MDALQGCRVYFDTNIFIYLLEGTAEFEAQMSELREGLQNREFEACASDLILTELLPPLVKNDNEEGIQTVVSLLNEREFFARIPCSQDVFIQAGFLRGRFGMKTPDAMHVSLALEGRCQVFLTNDKGIKCPGEMQRILISEY